MRRQVLSDSMERRIAQKERTAEHQLTRSDLDFPSQRGVKRESALVTVALQQRAPPRFGNVAHPFALDAFSIHLEAVHMPTAVVNEVEFIRARRRSRGSVQHEGGTAYGFRSLPAGRREPDGSEDVPQGVQYVRLPSRVAAEDARKRVAHCRPV